MRRVIGTAIALATVAAGIAGCDSGYVESTNPATASGNKRTKGGQPVTAPATASTTAGTTTSTTGQ